MPLPLIWIGVAAFGIATINELDAKRKRQDSQRDHDNDVTPRGTTNKHDSGIAKYPKEEFSNEKPAIVRPGALVCCGLGGMLEHTGILIDDDTIVELHGSGLIKAISPRRFLEERSGREIFVACDSKGEAIADDLICQRATQKIYGFQDYDIIKNNCHRFVWYCISGIDQPLTTFHQLNKRLSKRFDRKIYWDKWHIGHLD